MEKIPYLAIGDGELYDNADLCENDLIFCPRCKAPHKVKSSSGKTITILFYNCENKTYMCGMDGKAFSGIQKVKHED